MFNNQYFWDHESNTNVAAINTTLTNFNAVTNITAILIIVAIVIIILMCVFVRAGF